MWVPPIRTVPVTRTPSTRSFMRLRQRSSVDLPQPDGPMYAVTRCYGTDMDTSRSACLAPYQSDRCSISTIGASMIPEASAWGLRLPATLTVSAMSPPLLDRRRRVRAAEPVAQADRDQVQEDHDQQQQEQIGR